MERPKVIKDEKWVWLDESHPVNNYLKELNRYIDYLESITIEKKRVYPKPIFEPTEEEIQFIKANNEFWSHQFKKAAQASHADHKPTILP
jgi:hypothetical protein